MASIIFHPQGCSSGNGLVTLVSPGSAGTGTCFFNDGAFANSNPSGGYEIQGMPSTVSVTISQGPPDGTTCGEELIALEHQNGCYDFPNLSNRIWWAFCNTGKDCPGVTQRRSYPPPSLSKNAVAANKEIKRIVDVQKKDTRSLGVVYKDDEGDYLLSSTGRRIQVVYRNETLDLELDSSPIEKRQSQTFSPPSNCMLDSNTCQSLADSGQLRALCLDCEQGLGNGVKASGSSTIDCRNSGGPCPVTFTDSVTVTDTISESITFGATIGDTGKDGANGNANFNFGLSVSIATTHGTSEGLLIPQGKIGFVQFQPQAQLGTVVTTSSQGNVCDSAGLNKICGAQPGILVSSSNDADGQYSVVLSS
ncbi:uncharacterized protein TRIVIDRAFT_222460 [Trichoderma virens Gv29-8]|uniref:Uncharacterized protein n=1 Tax=Hypocrea virens (strain Gv29-8 / FGSC 10586) TaxID=413071 RepID=G9MTX8_HYPVG|nr:uncharacterized protein TRIVIDRAFT_222460 [Trichoderma virens Gv29-8]EHK22100.1 hypothetical protein TRIVIDRAFT_222460 [Trichoderma virens Gv29-8]UKZ48285.1 hypothetical protein TrVGV298_002508 [Trichoderma virens]